MNIKTSWDLSVLEKDINKREKVKEETCKFINKWKDRNDYLSKPKILKEALDEYEQLNKTTFGQGEEGRGSAEDYYFWLKKQQDQNDPKIKAGFKNVEHFSKKISHNLMFFMHNLAHVPKPKQKDFLQSKELEKYHHFLERQFEKAKHLLSIEEEKILSLKAGPAADNWENMVSGFISKSEKEILTEENKTETKAFSDIMGLMNSQQKKVRDTASKAFNEIIKENLEVAEAEINSLLENKKIDDELRKFPKPESERLLVDDIAPEVVDALIEAVTEKFEVSKRYYALKAKLFGVKKLQYHERNVPYGKAEKNYAFEDSVKLVDTTFQHLDKKFSKILNAFLENGQVDVYPKKGKREGAFCVYWLISHPTFVMMNHTNKTDDVRTLAHEFGHAINNELIKEKQLSLYYGTPTSTAEVASTFMEDFVFSRILQEAEPELKLALMMQKLNDDVSSIMRQIACYKFERELHDTFRKKNYLSKEDLGALFQKHMESYMGTAVEQSPGAENWWVYWGHIRMMFYVYSYASGLLISKALQKKFRENPKFIEKVKEFLSTGLAESPKNIFSKLGIDITKKEFWVSGLKETEDLLNETEALAKKLGKI